MIWSCPIIRDEEEDRGGFLVDLRAVVLTLVWWWWTATQQQTAPGPWLTPLSAGHSFLFSVCDL